MTQIPAESTVWRRMGAQDPASQDMPLVFPEAHRGEWMHDTHYAQLREEHCRRLDEDYAAWRRERFSRDFDDWRRSRPSQLQGQAQGQGLEQEQAQQDRSDTETFFERS